ncbi:21489_t:CDS:2 [Entrophospora sp. SA101]|nr:14456_t:CDS:2 [Entrophospora sp. SA101]CAJ0647622.1 12146_t:CDS:2 [Entrophospora sp. SA101]CAJ0755798.1 18273_t:CDS:2 [Entrophospora sp. SA101]CAJ0767172.1 21489_t:CDS:2 [Entrophospora sp. SA101]CAJ0839908.1 15017_t:CDS:2 [Entrophospora sp. SA101]
MYIDDSERLSKALSIPFDQVPYFKSWRISLKSHSLNLSEKIMFKCAISIRCCFRIVTEGNEINQALVIDKLIKDLLAILSEKYEIVMARNLSDHREEASSRLLDT